jgi:hypothetical protein
VGIKLIYESLRKQGEPDITRPAIICDECGREIESAGEGLYMFDGRLEHEDYWLSRPVDIYFVHKNRYGGCWSRFIERMGWEESSVTDNELGDLPGYLSNVLAEPPDSPADRIWRER